MFRYLAFLPDPVAQRRLSDAAKLGCAPCEPEPVRFASDWREMHELALDWLAHLAVFDPYAAGELDVDSCAEFAEAFPSCPLFAYGAFPRRAEEDVFRLTKLGVRGIGTRGYEMPTALRLQLTEAMEHTVVGAVLAALEDRLTNDLARLLRHLLSRVHQPLSPAAAARLYHSHERTLRGHLRCAGLPPINSLIVWFRLLHAAHLLQDSARSIENVALRLEFASVNSFRNQLQRYAGVSPSELRVRGGFQYLLEEFCRRCGGPEDAGVEPIEQEIGARSSGRV
jgi:AraC-like DNA-binding protein